MTPGFSTREIVVQSGDGLNFTLVQSFSFTAKDGQTITVPAGATTDGASVPREFWTTLPPFGSYWLAAVLHDFLYRGSDLPKERCDALLLEAMQSLSVPELEALAIYQGVRLGGQDSFESDRRLRPAV